MTCTALATDIEQLLQLASTMKQRQAGLRLEPIEQALAGLCAEGRGSPLAQEQRLERLTWSLRTRWMRAAQRDASRMLKSPALNRSYRLSTGTSLDHTYERNMSPTALERRLKEYRTVPAGWVAEHSVFSSGMAALATFYQSYLRMFQTAAARPLRMLNLGDYFEMRVLFGLLQRDGFSWTSSQRGDEFLEAVRGGAAEALHVEPVRYNWELDVLDPSELVSALQAQRTRATRLLVLDTTLSADTYPVPELLEKLGAQAPELVVQIASGLKLHQAGLEFANVGMLTVYARAGGSGERLAAQTIDFLRKMRTILGAGMPLEALSALEVPCFLDRETVQAHSTGVFRSNAALARELPAGGLFARIEHPARHRTELWANAPFTVFHLAEDDLENHGLLLSALAFEARRRKLCFAMGSSFGFRAHRFECIVPRISENRGLFKVAMGARQGPSNEGVRALLRELAELPSFAALRERYPQLRPVDLRQAVAQ